MIDFDRIREAGPQDTVFGSGWFGENFGKSFVDWWNSKSTGQKVGSFLMPGLHEGLQHVPNAFSQRNAETAAAQKAAEEQQRRDLQEARDWQEGQADKDRAFQEHMSSTQIQRLVADAKKAGINPMAVLGQAHAPSGSSAGTTQAFSLEEVEGLLGKLLNVVGRVFRVRI